MKAHSSCDFSTRNGTRYHFQEETGSKTPLPPFLFCALLRYEPGGEGNTLPRVIGRKTRTSNVSQCREVSWSLRGGHFSFRTALQAVKLNLFGCKAANSEAKPEDRGPPTFECVSR